MISDFHQFSILQFFKFQIPLPIPQKSESRNSAKMWQHVHVKDRSPSDTVGSRVWNQQRFSQTTSREQPHPEAGYETLELTVAVQTFVAVERAPVHGKRPVCFQIFTDFQFPEFKIQIHSQYPQKSKFPKPAKKNP